MFIKHPRHLFAAFVHGALDASTSAQVSEHVRRCPRCAAELQSIRRADNGVLHAPMLQAPSSLWNAIEAETQREGASQGAQIDDVRRGTAGAARSANAPSRRFIVAGISAAAALMIIALTPGRVNIWELGELRSGPAWQVTRLAGTPRVDARRIGQTAQLRTGQWLETDSRSHAEITVADIGRVDVEPNTLIGLVVTGVNEHRLSLQRGEMSARVLAPPRLFFVDTPSSTAVDLGCAYTLKVDANGDTVLHVTSGHVALTKPLSVRADVSREIDVLAGASCRTRRGMTTGTPIFDSATSIFKSAMLAYDLNRLSENDLDTALAAAKKSDTYSLWYAMSNPDIKPERRIRIINRMFQIVPPAHKRTRDGVLRGDSEILQQWRESLESDW